MVSVVGIVPWKEKPRRFVDPPLVTNQQVMAHKQVTKKEMDKVNADANATLQRSGSAVLSDTRTVFTIYKKNPVERPGLTFTYDKIRDDSGFDGKIPRDTCWLNASEATRKRCQFHMDTKRPIRTSQSYGRLPAYDNPKMGFNKVSVFMAGAMDASHLSVGGPKPAGAH